jgi:hypothetical protein
MKFFKWLGESRENEVPEVFGDSIKVILLGEQHGGGGSNPGPFVTEGLEGGTGICKVETKSFGKSIAGIGGAGGFSLKPSPTTFYPPIEEGKDEKGF